MFKKFLPVALMLSTLGASEHKLILHGASEHFETVGKKLAEYKQINHFNDANRGLGYEYTTYNKTDTFYNVSVSVLEDSIYEPQYSACVGVNSIVFKSSYVDVMVGLNVGLMQKVTQDTKDVYNKLSAKVLPMAFPRMAIRTKYIDFNVLVVPPIDSMNVNGLVHYFLGINF